MNVLYALIAILVGAILIANGWYGTGAGIIGAALALSGNADTITQVRNIIRVNNNLASEKPAQMFLRS